MLLGIGSTPHGDASVVFPDYALGHPQAQTSPGVALGGYEWFKKPLPHFRWNSVSCVCHKDANAAPAGTVLGVLDANS